MHPLDEALELVHEAMTETAEVQIERRVDWLIRELDELCALASNSETVDLVEAQQVGIGQIITRAQLISSFLILRKPLGKLRIISNG